MKKVGIALLAYSILSVSANAQSLNSACQDMTRFVKKHPLCILFGYEDDKKRLKGNLLAACEEAGLDNPRIYRENKAFNLHFETGNELYDISLPYSRVLLFSCNGLEQQIKKAFDLPVGHYDMKPVILRKSYK